MDFDQTQVLDLDDYLEDTEEEEDGISRLPVGYLKVLKFRGFPETSFPVYEGDNLIGRDDKCNITIPTKPVSKQHACIEIRDGTHLIYDCNSRNRTKRNKVFLKPRVRYELQNEDQLIFADVKCQYLLGTYKDEADDKDSETGSETGSESMLPESNEDLELEKNSKIITSSPKREKDLDESLENKLIQPIQDYRSKDSEIVSPVFCAETDSETDEEKDASGPGAEKEPGPTLLYSSQDNREAEKVDSSFVDDQTQQYSQENTGDNNCNMEATLPATLVIEPDIIPTTPGVFATVDEDKTSGVLKRAVEVRCDPFKRVSTGNTLDYGLETLETPNISRESVDTSGDDNKIYEFSLVKSSENVNTDLVSAEKSKDEMETVDNSKTLKETLHHEDVILDDLMATQSYEARNIPESPVSEDEAPFVKHDEDTMPEQYSLEATQAYAAGGNSLSGEASEDMATQAYGVFDEICASDEEADAKNATQAYGLDSDNFTLVEETGDGVATLAYEHVDSDSALPGDKGGGKPRQPAVVHAQQQGCMQDKELKKDNEELTLFDEFDGQSTQVYGTQVGIQSPGVNLISPVIKINVLNNGDQRKKQRSKVTFADTSDSESGACTKRDTKPVKTDESSDSAELPSLASLGISIGMEKEATDNEEDFVLPARRSSRIRTPSKRHAAESTSSSTRKSPSTVIEGENSLNSLKRCYVECTSENETSQANKMAKVGSPEIDTNEKVNSGASRGRGKTRGRSRKSVATERGKKGTGKRETDEVVGEELVELDKKEEFKDDNSKDQDKELVITSSGDKRSNSKNTKNKLNELVGEEVKKEETGMEIKEIKEIKKKNNKKNEKKERANENIDEKEYKGQGVTLNDEDNVKGSGKKCIGRGRKKSAIQQSVRFQKGKLEDSEEKITPEETERVSEKDESNEPLDMVISETKGAATPDLDVGDVMDVDERPGHEGIKQDEKDNRRLASTKDTDTHDFDATTKESKSGRVKKAGKGKIKNGESNQEDVKNVELAGKRRNTGTRGRVRKEIKTEDKVSENERLEAGPKGRMVKREIAARVDAEYNIEVKERKDDQEESKKKGRTGGKKASKDKYSEEDIFKFNDHDSESTPKPCSTTKSQVLQLSSASSACGKRSSSRTGRQDKVKEEKLTQHESAEFSESFLAPEMPVSSSQRSRRTSTSSETSSQGTPSRGRQRGKRSLAASSSVGSSPFKKTKLDPEPSSNIRVLFTGLASEAQARKIVEDLRGEVVDSVYECTHLVTDKVRRTVKFLCALSRGIPVVDKRWLQASKRCKSFIDCSSFTVKDKATEKQYEFSLDRSLEMAQAKGLLEGYTIHVTPHVVPKPEYMKDIIKCAKGEFAPKMPTSFSDHVLVVSCDEDKHLCQNAVGHVHTSELLLTGILRQQLDLEQYPYHFVRNENV